MSAPLRLVRFEVNGQGYAVDLNTVERVIRSVELSDLPGAPPVIRGIFNLHGRIIPVADPRRRLGLPDREIDLEDRIIIARTPVRLIGLLAHGDAEVAECDQGDVVRTDTVLPGLERIEGIGRVGDGLVLIQDLAKFLSIAEERTLSAALEARP